MEFAFPSDRIRNAVRARIGTLPKDFTAELQKRVSTGTVIIALKYRNGVLITADKQTSAGNKIWSTSSQKIRKLSSFSAMGACGVVCLIQILFDTYNETLAGLELEPGHLPLESQRRIFQKMLQAFFMEFGFYECGFIFAGKDPYYGRKLIVQFDEGGAYYSRKSFAADGSGGGDALPILKEYFRNHSPSDLSENAAVRLALRAMIQAGKGDAFVSDPEVILPTVAVIDGKGYRAIRDTVIEETLAKLMPQRRRSEGGRP